MKFKQVTAYTRVASTQFISKHPNRNDCFEYAMIPLDELRLIDWEECIDALRDHIEFQEDEDKCSTFDDYTRVIQDAGEFLGWISPEDHVMVGLAKHRTGPMRFDDEKGGRQFILGTARAIACGSTINESRLIAAKQRADDYLLEHEGQPVMAFLEGVPPHNGDKDSSVDSLSDNTVVESGFLSGGLDETVRGFHEAVTEITRHVPDASTPLVKSSVENMRKAVDSLQFTLVQKQKDEQAAEKVISLLRREKETLVEEMDQQLTHLEQEKQQEIRTQKLKIKALSDAITEKDQRNREIQREVVVSKGTSSRSSTKTDKPEGGGLDDTAQQLTLLKEKMAELERRELELSQSQRDLLGVIKSKTVKRRGKNSTRQELYADEDSSSSNEESREPETLVHTENKINVLSNGSRQEESTSTDEERKPRRRKGRGLNMICTPKRFGLIEWDPSSIDLSLHIDSVRRAVDEAREMGASEQQLIRLLVRSMPAKYAFMEHYISGEDRQTYEAFERELVKALGEKIQTQMSDFIGAQRRPGELILSYFFRLTMLYKSTNNFRDDEWQNEPTHTAAVYTKLYNALYPAAQAELARRVDTKLENHELTVKELKKELTEVSKMSKNSITAETPTVNVVNSAKDKNVQQPWSKPENPRKVSFEVSEGQVKKSDLKCWFCDKVGHVRSECFAYKRAQAEVNNGRSARGRRDGRFVQRPYGRRQTNWTGNWKREAEKEDVPTSQ